MFVDCCISSFLGEHGQVIASDFFAKKGKKSSVEQSTESKNEDSKDDSLILISPPPKSASKSGSSKPLVEKKTNSSSAQPTKNNQSKTYEDQPSTSGLTSVPQTVPQRSSPPIISFSAMKENDKPAPKKRKPAEELSVSWNSNPSPKQPPKKIKSDSETICLSDDEADENHDDDTPLRLGI